MSERKLRYLFKSMHDDYALGGYYKMVAAAMAEEPDMVGLLRWLDTEENLGEIVLAEDDDLMPDEYRDFIAMAGWIRDVKGWIERTFHVRLTDDGGYEWTD